MLGKNNLNATLQALIKDEINVIKFTQTQSKDKIANHEH